MLVLGFHVCFWLCLQVFFLKLVFIFFPWCSFSLLYCFWEQIYQFILEGTGSLLDMKSSVAREF